MDNAANNHTAMTEIGKILRAREIEFDDKDRTIMCFPHVVSLSSGRIIQGITKVLQPKEVEKWEPSLRHVGDQSYAAAVARDPIALGREVVRVIQASGVRREAFDDIITTGNAKNWFKDGEKTIQVRQLQLLRDVSTRWDSVYYMISRLREMRPVSYFSKCLVFFLFLTIGPLRSNRLWTISSLTQTTMTLPNTRLVHKNGLSCKILK
jgi:hypothetical protein